MKLDSMTSLYVSELRDMHSAEKQLIAALPKLAKAAGTPELAQAFEDHLEETKVHLERINTILEGLGEKPGRDKCEAMAGLVEESKEVIDAKGEDDVRNAALIVAAQKAEHYEIASYGSLCVFAKLMGRRQDAKLLGQTLDEEKAADLKLTELAESTINVEAMQPGNASRAKAGSTR
jgi:ferritin-like metal-binding protein YciE